MLEFHIIFGTLGVWLHPVYFENDNPSRRATVKQFEIIFARNGQLDVLVNSAFRDKINLVNYSQGRIRHGILGNIDISIPSDSTLIKGLNVYCVRERKK